MGNSGSLSFQTHRRIVLDRHTETEIAKEAAKQGIKVCHFRGLLLKKGLAAVQCEKETPNVNSME